MFKESPACDLEYNTDGLSEYMNFGIMNCVDESYAREVGGKASKHQTAISPIAAAQWDRVQLDVSLSVPAATERCTVELST